MNANQRRNRRQSDTRALADTSHLGRDYMVSYFLNEFQRGSMVMRFDKDPTRVQLLAELAKYGLEPSALKDVSASPMADVKDQHARYEQAQRATRAAHAHSQTLHVQTQSAQKSQESQSVAQVKPWDVVRSSRPRTRKVARLNYLPGLLIGFYLITVLMASDSYDEGEFAAVVNVPVEADLSQQIENCTTLLNESAREGQAVYGDNPGFFDDRVSTFLPHPANLSYLVGCLLN